MRSVPNRIYSVCTAHSDVVYQLRNFVSPPVGAASRSFPSSGAPASHHHRRSCNCRVLTCSLA